MSDIVRRIALRARGFGYTAAQMGAWSNDDWRDFAVASDTRFASATDCADAVDLVLLWEQQPALIQDDDRNAR